MQRIAYREVPGRGGAFYLLLAVLGAILIGGLVSAYRMEHGGHVITGMTNQIVWGMPHVFAVFLIVAASGALNVASIASVFGRGIYKPLAPLSGVLAIALLLGGLAVLVLDLGRPDRLIVAMTTYNFKSIFAWNIFLYTGFVAVVLIYLWVMMERRMNRFGKPVGLFAFLWRLTLTTGTGCIFGFLVAREAYDAAVMAPLFIAMSFAYGMAIFVLVLIAVCRWAGCELGDAIMGRLRRLLGVFAGAVLYFVAVQHLTNLYASEHHGVEAFFLAGGGAYTAIFWIGQIALGGVVPLILVYHPAARGSLGATGLAAALMILGGLAQVYLIIIGGQAYPLVLFPGMETSSSFFDGVVAEYTPSAVEILLGIGGVALALLVVAVGVRTLPFVPASLADADIDPHFRAPELQIEEAPGDGAAAQADAM
jgi:Ni/Fe-hydrogenase subunit HybB-like protein